MELKFFLEDMAGINVYRVSSRLKSYKSAIKKCRGSRRAIAKLQDIAGLRVVVATSTEIDVIARFFSRKADSRDVTIITDKPIRKSDGYRARHLIIEFKGSYKRSMHPTRVEVQLQTIMESAYNFISRAWVYKKDLCFSESWQEEFHQVSIVLADLDARVAKLQAGVLDSSARFGPNEPLTPFSFQQIITDTFSERVELNNAVDCVRFLIDLQCDTNSKLRTFFGREDILDLRNRVLKLGSEKGGFLFQSARDMQKHDFYLTFGCRMEAVEELLRSRLGATDEKG
jgi:ppGpp synthetase/RelA/SpoT-type nucleotidyltranferase